MRPSPTRAVIVLTVVGVTIDRVLKYLAISGTTLGPTDGGVRFELLPNPAIGFSLGFPAMWSKILIPMVLLAFTWYGIRRWRVGDRFRAVAALLVVVASSSNLYDRWHYDYVVDYLSLGRWFPVFNFSDILIIVGLVLVLSRPSADPISQPNTRSVQSRPPS